MNSTSMMDGKLCARTIGQRWADALRNEYPTDTVKALMHDFDAAEGTVKGWLAGQPPQQRHIARAINLHGPNFAGEIYAPGASWSRAAALKAKLAAIQAALSEALHEIEGLGE